VFAVGRDCRYSTAQYVVFWQARPSDQFQHLAYIT
jgi:hypothetical protein